MPSNRGILPFNIGPIILLWIIGYLVFPIQLSSMGKMGHLPDASRVILTFLSSDRHDPLHVYRAANNNMLSLLLFSVSVIRGR